MGEMKNLGMSMMIDGTIMKATGLVYSDIREIYKFLIDFLPNLLTKLVDVVLKDEYLFMITSKIFDELDKDGSGYLEDNEIRSLIEKISEVLKLGWFSKNVANYAWKWYDSNHDGKLDKKEF